MAGPEPKLRELVSKAAGFQTRAEQAAFLDEACGGDASLRDRLEQLLVAHREAGSFLREPSPAMVATVDQPPPAERIGTIIGPYKLLEQIGEGGFGVVFMAEQRLPVRRMVAIKVLKPGMDTRQVVARFEQERHALALMDHPNIARVLDAGATPTGRPFFVMELVRGLPISAYCDDARLTLRHRLEVFATVCQAVQHAHQKGLIHRDLKPSNVLVTVVDGRPVPKVIDFGIAKAVGGPLTDATLFTGFAQMVGTPLYMSPEQAAVSGQDVDTRADVYSLGVMLYELLTGTTPFDKERLKRAAFDEVRRIIREEDPPKPSTRLSESKSLPSVSALRQTLPSKLAGLVRGELDWIVMKCLEKDRDRRYETVNGLGQDIQRYLTDEPVQACPPSARYRLGKFLRRNKGSVLMAALLLLALFGSGIGLIESRKQREVSALWRQAEVARGDAETARDREMAARREAEKARETLAAVEYGRTMQLAYQEWRDNNVPNTLALLDSTRSELRGWEWRYVHRLCHSQLLSLKGHQSAVMSASFSPDGARIVTGSEDKTAKVWDARSGTEILTFRGHTGVVRSAAFSPDGSRIVTAAHDLLVRVWDPRTGAEVITFKGHTGAVLSASFSPDGSRVITGSHDRTARVWDAKTGAELLSLKGHGGDVMSASFSPDASRVLTASRDQTARVWDAKTGAELLTFKGHTGPVLSASFSPDCLRIVTGGRDNTARIWDAKTAIVVLSLGGHTDAVTSASFSPDGSRVITGSHDRTARIWDTKTGKELLILKGHTSEIVSAAFSADGTRVVTGSGESAARVWDARTGAEFLALEGHTGIVRSASFNVDGSRVVTASADNSSKVWDAKSGAELLTFKGYTGIVPAAALSPDGTRVITGSSGRTPMAWKPETGAPRLWDAKTGAELFALKGHAGDIWSVGFSPDGSRAVTGSEDDTARVWDAESGAQVFALAGHTGGVFSVSFSPDGTRIATGSKDLTAKMWNAKSGAEILSLRGHSGTVYSASFSPDGLLLVTAGDTTARVWDARSGAELVAFKGHTGRVRSASFSPDLTRVVTASLDDTARVWDARSGAQVLALKGHTGGVYSASFSPDGSRLLTAGDITARVWNAAPVP